MNTFGGLISTLLSQAAPRQFSNNIFATLDGWDVYNTRVYLDGGSTILGFPTPVDSAPKSSDAHSVSGMTYSHSLTADIPAGSPPGTKSIRLLSTGGTVSVGYGVVHGPYVVSTDFTYINAGNTVDFWWKAEGGSDAFDIYGYILNIDTGETFQLVNATGTTDKAVTAWTKARLVLPAGKSGRYHFVFISGSYDFTGGRALGASLYITNINVS